MTPDFYFNGLAAARAKELKGWVAVATWLRVIEDTGWWKAYGESEIEVLAQPEFQIPKTTAQQYRRIIKAFWACEDEELEACRPRLLFQACEAVENGADPAEVLSDAQVLSWDSFIRNWNPKKAKPLPSSLPEGEREEGREKGTNGQS
jgi:hypothetical protein